MKGTTPEREPGASRFRPSLQYRFGPFELAPDAVELRRHGVRVPLTGQPLRILLMLLQSPERVVTREELRDALWPGDVHVSFDGALNTAVRKLRLSLEDNPVEERYIQTVPRLGYRFVADVEVIAPAVSAPPAVVPDLPPPAEAEPQRRTWLWIAIAAAVLAGIGAGEWWRLSRAPVSLSLANRAYVTSFPGEQAYPTMSPDGGQVAFTWTDLERDKVPSIYVTSFSGLGLHRLTNSGFSDYGPAWSPDGSQIAFVRETPDEVDSILVISSSGGPERRITETDSRFVSWAPGGHAVLATHKKRGERNFELWSVSVENGERHALTPPGEYMDGWERFAYSPDGSLLAYAGWTGEKGLPEIYVRPASGGKARRVNLPGSRLHAWWCWMPDSRSILIVSQEPGTRRLFRIRVDDPHATPEPIEGAGDDLMYPAVVLAGGKSRLVFCQQRLTSNLHRFSIRRDRNGKPVALDAVQAIAPATRTTVNPEISPNGRRLTFVSDRSLFTEIWLSEEDGRNPHPLSSFSSSQTIPGSPQWSPDGSRIVFAAPRNDVTELYLTAADGGPLAQLTHQSFDVIRPSFSRDGRWIYFGKRDRVAERQRLWKIPARADAAEKDATPIFGPGSEIQGTEPIEAPEGGTLYFVGQEAPELWSVPVAGGQPKKVIGSGIKIGWWTPVPGGVFYVDISRTDKPDEPTHPPVLYFDAASGTSRVIGELPAQPNILQPGLSVRGDSLWTDWMDVSTINLIRGEIR